MRTDHCELENVIQIAAIQPGIKVAATRLKKMIKARIMAAIKRKCVSELGLLVIVRARCRLRQVDAEDQCSGTVGVRQTRPVLLTSHHCPPQLDMGHYLSSSMYVVVHVFTLHPSRSHTQSVSVLFLNRDNCRLSCN